MKKGKLAFVSYRNTIKDDTFVNYEILRKFLPKLKARWPEYEFITVEPESLPRGTLFSPYDIADFIHTTFNEYIDRCDKFIIFNKDFFDEEDNFTSFWTEAEVYIWSYYSRSKWYRVGRNKDAFYTILTPTDSEFREFNVSEIPLIDLTDGQRLQLRQCALDFDKQPLRPDYSWPYLKSAKNLIVICNQCNHKHMVDKGIVKQDCTYLSRCSNCHNEFLFSKYRDYIVCSQPEAPTRNNVTSVFEMLELLFDKKPRYPLIELNEVNEDKLSILC